MEYTDEINYALRVRDQRAIDENEKELLMTIQFTLNTKFTKPGSKRYSQQFLNALVLAGIDCYKPQASEDGKWHFELPRLEGDINEG